VTATGLKPRGIFRELVAVRIPDLQLFRQPGEQRATGILHHERAFAVFALEALFNPAPQKLRKELQAKADAQHRQAERKEGFIR